LLPVDGQRLTNWTRTDARGRFEYSSLQARRYTLSARAERFISLEYGQTRPDGTGMQFSLRDGEEFPVEIKLPRTLAVGGSLLDEFGDPAPNITVGAARRTYVSGQYRVVPCCGRSLPTDDLGRYRIVGLSPGEYYIVALPGVYTEIGETVGSFAPTYYPGTL